MIPDSRLSQQLKSQLKIPVMAGPMFIASTADLAIAQCNAGIIGSMPALNPRTTEALDQDIARIKKNVGDMPYAINLVAHSTNSRLKADLDVVMKHKVPIVVLALAANPDLVRQLQTNGSLVFQDVVKNRHARKCAEMGVDGIIAVGAGAGGHTGNISPFALVQEIREWWEGLLILSGCIANGRSVLAAEALGADLAYIGSPFLASAEADTQDDFKRMIVEGAADDIVTTNCFTGVDANFLKPSLLQHGVDPANLARSEGKGINIDGGGDNAKAWKEIWSAGQGIGAVKRSEPAGEYIDWLVKDYAQARNRMNLVT
ncbi:2-nitropropane dioxygenase [Sphingomonadales bacterium EhC05]|nr:2-nitropropane dioxygenase [Sphingomonadales bacterium EhC05]